MTNQILKKSLLFASLALLPGLANASEEVLYTKLVQPILNAKCVSCHGAEKQKGKLRLDSIEEILKGSDGSNVVPGKLEESYLVERIDLPSDDDDHMPPEDEPQLTKEEIAVLKFWVQSGAKPDAKISALKPAGEFDAAIKVVLANPPKAAAPAAAPAETVDPAKLKLAEETIKKVEETGASLMAIAQDTPDLRFSALNVAKEYGDKNLELLKPVADQVKWMDLARSQVTDAGLANLAAMKNLNRLHLENTKITDAGLDHLKGLANLEYLNLYGTAVTDAGIAKLGGLKKLKKLFVWQTKVTDDGAKKLAAAVPGLYVNTGWKEPAKPVTVAANTTKPASPAAPKPATPKPTPKPEPKKPEPKKPEPKKPEPPKPATPKPATPAPKPVVTPAAAAATKTIADLGATIDKAIADAKAASANAAKVATSAGGTATEAKKIAEEAKKAGATNATAAADAKKAADEAKKIAGEAKAAADAARKAADEAKKAAEAANAVASQAKAALEQLQKAAAAIATAAAPEKKQ